MQKTILIAGCGDLGNAIGTRLIELGHRVYGLRRNIDQLSESIQPIAFDLLSNNPIPALPTIDFLIYAAAAKSRDQVTYRKIYLEAPRQLADALAGQSYQAILVSSTGVYSQNDGNWIDESSAAEPNNPYGALMLEGELALAAQASECTVVRSSGIYGPGRNHLIQRVLSGTLAPEAPIHFSNRIHRDDLACFIVHLVSKRASGETLEPLYLASDGEPTPIHEVTAWLAEQLGVTPQEYEPIQRGGNKRVANRAMRESGFVCRYPNYQSGFAANIEELKSSLDAKPAL